MENKYYRYDVRQLDCWVNPDCVDNDSDIDSYLINNKDVYNWDINNSFHFGIMETNAENVKKALSQYLKRHFNISFYANKVRYIEEYDGVIYIVNSDNYQPIFMAIPQDF